MTSSSDTPNSERTLSVFPHPSFVASSSQQPEFANRFLPRLVHETRSPTHAITYFLEAFTDSLEATQLTAEAKENLEMIRNSADELRVLLRSLSRLAHSQDEKRIAEVRVRPAIEKAWLAIESSYDATAHLSADCGDLTLQADDRVLDICFQCIIDNCFKFRHSERPLEVNVTTRQDDTSVTIDFMDNGIGIEEKYLDKCYQYFERLHSRSLYPGGGLGIPTAIECIKHISGELTLESDGSTYSKVTLTFPKTQSK